MSIMTELMYNALNVVREECKRCDQCVDCVFYSTNICNRGISPCAWSNDDIEKTVDVIDKKYHK